jgi:hypothetical protein
MSSISGTTPDESMPLFVTYTSMRVAALPAGARRAQLRRPGPDEAGHEANRRATTDARVRAAGFFEANVRRRSG